MPSKPHAERDEVVNALVERARRRDGGVPLRNVLVQRGTQSKPAPGPLSTLVRNHDERALDLYLMARAVISSDLITEAWDVRLAASVWSRGLGLPTPTNNGAAAVSKVWRRLDDLALVSRARQGARANITILDEEGTGLDYAYPSGKGRGRYFKLSEKFWTADERWYRTLSLAAKSMLLVSSSLKPGFVLPLEQIPKWYGISADTAGRGFDELERKGLLQVDKKSRREPLSPEKYVIENVYTLLGPFAQDWSTQSLASVTTLHTGATSEGA